MGGNPESNPPIMPMMWWFGFGRSYQDGRVGEEGRVCHVLSEFEFANRAPDQWYSDQPLSSWKGVSLLLDDDSVVGLQRLSVVCKGLTAVPESIVSLSINAKWPTDINLSGNMLACLPNSICQLSSLITLRLSVNNLVSLPESIGNLSKLENCFLDNNRLSSLPESFISLTRLLDLKLNCNVFTELPICIPQLTSITALNISQNPFVLMPLERERILRMLTRDGLVIAC